MEIRIKTVPKEKIKSGLASEYWYDEDAVLQVRVSETGEEFGEKVIAISTIVEEAITKKIGLSGEEIRNFVEYRAERVKIGMDYLESDPGLNKDAPNLREHLLAKSIEMMLLSF